MRTQTREVIKSATPRDMFTIVVWFASVLSMHLKEIRHKTGAGQAATMYHIDH